MELRDLSDELLKKLLSIGKDIKISAIKKELKRRDEKRWEAWFKEHHIVNMYEHEFLSPPPPLGREVCQRYKHKF